MILIGSGCASLSCFSIDGKAFGWCIAKKQAAEFCGRPEDDTVFTYQPSGYIICDRNYHEINVRPKK